MPDVVLGIDLSLRGLGLCAVPTDWDLDPRRVRAVTLAVPLRKDATTREQVERLRSLALDVRTWAVRVGATRAWVESYAFNMAHGAHYLAELGGVVKLELMRECGLDIAVANMSSARKLLYGRIPPRGIPQAQRKAWLLEPLRLAGLQLDNDNEGDAFCVANWGLSELGAPCFAQLLGVPEAKPKRRRKAA